MDWNDESIGRLRQFWADGHSTAEIGRRMGVTKNAVVGKAHRLTLSPRPSPIRRDSQQVAARTVSRRVSGPTLPSLMVGNVVPMIQDTARIEPAKTPPVPTRVVASSRPSQRVTACCWPIGEPGTRSFRFCDGDAMHGKPYCQEHAQIAYVKIRERREDVA